VQRGFSLVALMAGITMAMLVLGAALPAWRYIVKDDREQELIFRGLQIADAVQRYQAKHKTLPASLEVLVKGRFLRKLYKDPMVKDGKWRLMRQGEGAGGVPGGPKGGPSPPPTTRPSGPGGTPGGSYGVISGVASLSNERGLRLYNGKQRYSEWIFALGQPRVVGKTPLAPPVVGPGGPGVPPRGGSPPPPPPPSLPGTVPE
jgi:type II secretory pathway pseudopilin PulG